MKTPFSRTLTGPDVPAAFRQYLTSSQPRDFSEKTDFSGHPAVSNKRGAVKLEIRRTDKDHTRRGARFTKYLTIILR